MILYSRILYYGNSIVPQQSATGVRAASMQGRAAGEKTQHKDAWLLPVSLTATRWPARPALSRSWSY
jgi:hypothetical protein